MSDINEDIAAAVESVSKSMEAPSEAAPSGPNRDASGRFAARIDSDLSGDPEPAPDPTPAPTAPGATGEPADTPPGMVAATPAAASPEPSGAVGLFDPSRPPSSWTNEMKGVWGTIPDNVRREIMRREEATHIGFDKFRNQVAPAVELHDHLSQFGQYFQSIGKEPKQYLSEVIQMEHSLATGNPAQRMETVLNIADQYGVPIRQALDKFMHGKLQETIQQSHQHYNTPPPVPPEIQRELEEARRFRQQFEDQQIRAELSQITNNPDQYPLFEELREKMADLLDRGKADSYDEAYNMALFLDPNARSKMQAIEQGRQQQEAIRQRQRQAASVATPSSSAITPPPVAEPDSIEDHIRQAYAAAAGAGRV